jgi:hypothetical protein
MTDCLNAHIKDILNPWGLGWLYCSCDECYRPLSFHMLESVDLDDVWFRGILSPITPPPSPCRMAMDGESFYESSSTSDDSGEDWRDSKVSHGYQNSSSWWQHDDSDYEAVDIIPRVSHCIATEDDNEPRFLVLKQAKQFKEPEDNGCSCGSCIDGIISPTMSWKLQRKRPDNNHSTQY